jgi:hypothetical protein
MYFNLFTYNQKSPDSSKGGQNLFWQPSSYNIIPDSKQASILP